MNGWAGVVMAAGMGKRMKSAVPKIFHQVCGREALLYPIDALRDSGISRIVVVLAPGNLERAKALLGDTVEYVFQDPSLGTGHALLQAAPLLEGHADRIIAVNADTPLTRSATLQALRELHLEANAPITFLSALSDQHGMGRVVRDAAGRVVEIVEATEPSHPLGVAPEVNGGAYCFQASWLWDRLPGVEKSPVGEHYLTALVELAASEGAEVTAMTTPDPEEVLGINDRIQLAQAEAAMRRRIRDHWMVEGVTMLDPGSTFLDATVEVGQDTVIYPNTMVAGNTKVGKGCTLGPGSIIRDSLIGDDCRIVASFLEETTIEASVEVGPFCRLRSGTYLESEVHLGSFAEIKNSRLARGVAMGHFGYVGDASIGEGVNLGAGTVTCNYDGVSKHRTVVGKGAFIGSDTMLVAPVEIGDGAVTGAGSVVTRDVPAYRLAVGVPATIRPREHDKSLD